MTLADVLARTGALLDQVGVPHAVIGGQAVLLHDMDRYKLFASRPKDSDDVKGILLRQRGKLDLDHIRFRLPQFGEIADDSDLAQTFEDMVRRYYCPPDEGEL